MSTTPAFDLGQPSERADGHETRPDVCKFPTAPVQDAPERNSAKASRTSAPDGRKQTTVRTHLTTPILRKSASADSCISHRISPRSDSPINGLHCDRDDASVHLDEEPSKSQLERTDARTLSSPPSAMSLSGILRSKVGRKRGVSNANTTDNETSAPEESDLEKSNGWSGRVRARLLSLKSNKNSGSNSEPSDVPRLPSRGASTSLSNLKASNSSDSRPAPNAMVSSQEPDRAGPKATKRSRSHSVGPPSKNTTQKIAKRLSFGNQAPRKPEITREISIAVIGPPSCGKSTFIRKGLKKHDLSGPETLSATVAIGNTTRNVNYIRRTAHLLNEFNTDTTVLVYEYNSLEWRDDDWAALLSVWPAGLPRPDGAFICYDESDRASFLDVVQLATGLKALRIPTLVIACKADLEKRVPPEEAAIAVHPYSKLIEVSHHSDEGKRHMRKAVEHLVKQVVALQFPSHPLTVARAKRESVTSVDLPVEGVKKATDVSLSVQTGGSATSIDLASPNSPQSPSMGQSFSLRTRLSSSPSPSAGRSPTKACSMNDLRNDHRHFVSPTVLSDNEKLKQSHASLSSSSTKSAESLVGSPAPRRPISSLSLRAIEKGRVSCSNCSDRERQNTRSPPSPWVTLDELLEKLFFLAISGDDPSFISHFFLTYRRFATPRSILLGMQKRMNELRQSTGDVALSCFAQMRICNLLEQWIKDYPSDFAVPGTYGALHAVIRHVLAYSHTLSYGSEFLPFLDTLGTLRDSETPWALKADDYNTHESDTEVDSMFDADFGSLDTGKVSPISSLSPRPSRNSTSEASNSPRSSTRERRSSLPLNAMALLKAPILNAFHNADERSGPSAKEIVSKLQRTATALSNYEADSIADEITRRELELFLRIEPRDWLRHTLIPGKKDPKTDPIAKFNAHYNDLHEWAVSLILCHDKAKSRARQIEKFAEVASKLRLLNNYSALRALITAINQATYHGDPSMEIFKLRVDLHKKFLSSDILLRTTGAHQSYRMALRNTKGPCIPSLEVHTSDLRRAHEGNPDTKPDDPSKINWAKYNMMGRFIGITTAIQERCTGRNGYHFTENKYLSQFFDVPVMDYEMQQSRMAQFSNDDAPPPSHPGSSTNVAANHSKDNSSVIKRILQW